MVHAGAVKAQNILAGIFENVVQSSGDLVNASARQDFYEHLLKQIAIFEISHHTENVSKTYKFLGGLQSMKISQLLVEVGVSQRSL